MEGVRAVFARALFAVRTQVRGQSRSPMIAFVVRRLLQSILVLLAVGFIAFSLFTYVGDPINNMVGQDTSPEQRAELRQRPGLDDPFPLQYGRLLGKIGRPAGRGRGCRYG